MSALGYGVRDERRGRVLWAATIAALALVGVVAIFTKHGLTDYGAYEN